MFINGSNNKSPRLFIKNAIAIMLVLGITPTYAQKKEGVFVDKKGILRWKKDNAEAAFFGVNYTIPFAYGYRSHKALNVDLEKAIDADVYHMARLGFDGFRVHVWDTEITDSSGNLFENDHLRLFDYLVMKLKERNIKIFLTPLAYWGNGYPEKDENTGSFSSKHNKQEVLVNENAIKAQENYLRQFLKHVNPYTKLTYGNDPDIIALEINNEPKHSGPKVKVTEYVNRMVEAVRLSGWMKPVFYNISESPAYADAVSISKIDGVSFQWYPTGLVANREISGNYLPHVDKYRIPFGDTIPAFSNKARMVYEFDAGDVLQSYMYPAMARSFREAGMQWATQFAYDPMATAYANTEYQTHYLNLAYTPSKAISLLIASKAFHRLQLFKSYGTYPADTLFDQFRVSYMESLSEMNSGSEFYYSNSTSTKPVDAKRLDHIAGVGNSPIVEYEGSGAYFLDRQVDGSWRLEVMPDAVNVLDPFEKASLKKQVTIIKWNPRKMSVRLPGMEEKFSVIALDKGNDYSTVSIGGKFTIMPGSYILKTTENTKANTGSMGKPANIKLHEFVAPQPTPGIFFHHLPFPEFTVGKAFDIKCKIAGVDSNASINLELQNSSGKWKTIKFIKISGDDYSAEISADMLTPGVVNYRILIQNDKEQIVFPGGHKGDPFAWDNFKKETYQSYVTSAFTPIELFNANTDRHKLNIYNPDWRNNSLEYITSNRPNQLVMKINAKNLKPQEMFGWQFYFGDKVRGRLSELKDFHSISLRGSNAGSGTQRIKFSLITKNGAAFSKWIEVGQGFQDINIAISSLMPDSSLLLPRAYPGFQPLWIKVENGKLPDIRDAEKIEILVFPNPGSGSSEKPVNVEIETIWLNKFV